MKNVIVSAFIVLLSLIIVVISYNLFIAKVEITSRENITEKQKKLEKKVNSYGYTIDNPNIILNPYQISPLTALVIFETKEEIAPQVQVVGKNESSTITYTSPPSRVHYLPIYGLYENYNNEIIISYNKTIKKINIQTGKIKKLPEITVNRSNNIKNDLYLLTPTSTNNPLAIDSNGDIRWYLTENFSWAIKQLQNGHIMLSTNNISEYPYYTTGLYEMDLLGKIYKMYEITNGFHHDFIELPNDNLLILTKNDQNEDLVQEIDRQNGDIIKTINLYEKVYQYNLNKVNNYSLTNSLDYNEKTHSILLTSTPLSTIYSLDYKTGSINYLLGSSNNYQGPLHRLFLNINNLELLSPIRAINLSNQNILIHNNQEVVMVNLNTKQKETILTNPSTITNGDIDYLGENNYLIESVNNHGTTIREIKDNSDNITLHLDSDYYQITKIIPQIEYSRGKSINLASKTETKYSKKNKLIINKNSSKEIINRHQIKIYKETDYLIFKGIFSKDDQVKIILEHNLIKKVYSITPNKSVNYTNSIHPLTKNFLIKYINNANLNGKYTIYIDINNQIYKTNQYVIF